MAGVTLPRQGWSDYGVEMSVKEVPTIGAIYRHFKGGVYQVISLAKCADDGRTEYVIYKSLMYGDIWIRTLEEFMSDVDAEKYPEFAGKPRLELVGKPCHLIG